MPRRRAPHRHPLSVRRVASVRLSPVRPRGTRKDIRRNKPFRGRRAISRVFRSRDDCYGIKQLAGGKQNPMGTLREPHWSGKRFGCRFHSKCFSFLFPRLFTVLLIIPPLAVKCVLNISNS